MSTALRLLLVEDNPGDVVLIKEAFKDADADVSLDHVSTVTATREALLTPPDAVLLDLNLPDSQGLETVAAVRESAPHTPIVVFTGLADEHVGLEAVRLGAQDYLIKGANDGHRMLQAIRYAIERQHAEDRLLATAAALQASNRALDEFASIASHDLRDPLAKILAFSRMLLDANAVSDKEDCESLREIHASATRMKQLIDALLEYARAVRSPEHVNDVPLNTVIREVLADLQVRIEEVGAHIDVTPLPVVAGDSVRLRQLFQNLISNALRFKHPDRPLAISVSAFVNPVRREVTVQVKDNGRGFDAADREHIFKPFAQLSDGRGEGSGLGLAICRRIVDAHRGTISAQSTPGAGAIFTFTLPLQSVTPEASEPQATAARGR